MLLAQPLQLFCRSLAFAFLPFLAAGLVVLVGVVTFAGLVFTGANVKDQCEQQKVSKPLLGSKWDHDLPRKRLIRVIKDDMLDWWPLEISNQAR